MPVPKRKHSRSRRDSKLSHQAIKINSFTSSANMNATLVRKVTKRLVELLKETGTTDKQSIKGSMNTVCKEFGLREAQCVHPLKLAMIKLRTSPTAAMPAQSQESTTEAASAA